MRNICLQLLLDSALLRGAGNSKKARAGELSQRGGELAQRGGGEFVAENSEKRGTPKLAWRGFFQNGELPYARYAPICNHELK